MEFEIKALKNCCKAIYGGVSWPGKRPGFAVVVAMDRTRQVDNHDVCLLAEFESVSPREVVRQCGALNFTYMPRRWIADWQYRAAWNFIQEMYDEP